MTAPSLLSAAGLLLLVLILWAFWNARGIRQRTDAVLQAREIDRLRASLSSLIYDRDRWVTRALNAEQDGAYLREALERAVDLDMSKAVLPPEKVDGIMSAVERVAREREYRAHRALTSPDHLARYGFGGDNDGEIAEAVCAMWLTPEGERE